MKPGKDHPSWLHKAMAEGGWVGEGDSSRAKKEQSAALSDEAKSAGNTAKLLGATSLGGLGMMVKSRSIPRALASAYTALGAGAGTAIKGGQAWLKSSQAEKANKEGDEAEGHAKGGKVGGKLTAKARKHIKAKNFALPGRRYPIEDAGHARNALSRVSGNGTPAEKAKVRRAVHRKYPGIGKD